jgi:hypothetical protein
MAPGSWSTNQFGRESDRESSSTGSMSVMGSRVENRRSDCSLPNWVTRPFLSLATSGQLNVCPHPQKLCRRYFATATSS